MDYALYFKDKPPPVFQEFAIAICDMLLEHEWPADVTRAITDVLAAALSGDTNIVAYAAATAARAAYAAATAARAAAHAADAAAAYAAYAAAYVAYAAADAAYAAADAAAHATAAADAAAAHAADAARAAKQAIPVQANRIDTVIMMLT